jgi:hypothetical protein
MTYHINDRVIPQDEYPLTPFTEPLAVQKLLAAKLGK